MEWHRSFIDVVDKGKRKGIVFYGAGFWGSIAYDLFSLFGIKPLCYCDDDIEKIGSMYYHTNIHSLEEAVRNYKDAIFITCIDETRDIAKKRLKREKMLDRLREYGVYTADSEIRLSYYIFLLDINKDKILAPVSTLVREKEFNWKNLNKIILFNNMSNSGAYYCEQLLDYHSHILFLPYVESLETVYEKRLQYLAGNELIIEITAQLLGFFNSKYEDIECVGQNIFQNLCTDINGNFIKDIYVNPEDFIINLKKQFSNTVKLKSYAHFLKVIFAAYNNTLGRKKEENIDYWIFYHMHLPNYDVRDTYNNLSKDEFKRIENLIIIREPVQHLYSWINRAVLNDSGFLINKNYFINVLKSELGINLEKVEGYENLRVIKFEDLKYKTQDTLLALCSWLEIPFEECLNSTTINGIEVYFPVKTLEGIKYITGNDKTSVGNKDFSSLMTLWDEVRFNMIYAKMKEAYGYENSIPDFSHWNKEELEKIMEKKFKISEIIEDIADKKYGGEEWKNIDNDIKELFKDYVSNYSQCTTYYKYIGKIE